MLVFGALTQEELDRQYDQSQWSFQPPAHYEQRYRALSERARASLGQPEEHSYGATDAERLDVYRAASEGCPIVMFFHGGAWRSLDKEISAFPADVFVSRGVCYVAVEFGLLPSVTLPVMVDQVRRSVAWAHRNGRSFGGDPDRIFVIGHSSGAHLAACAAVTGWADEFGLPVDLIKGAVCISGGYDLAAVQMSARNRYMNLTDAMVAELSPNRHMSALRCPLALAVAEHESPEFRRQSEVMAAAAGVPLHVSRGDDHFSISLTLCDPENWAMRAALAQIFGHSPRVPA